jgi:hypothetical protein
MMCCGSITLQCPISSTAMYTVQKSFGFFSSYNFLSHCCAPVSLISANLLVYIYRGRQVASKAKMMMFRLWQINGGRPIVSNIPPNNHHPPPSTQNIEGKVGPFLLLLLIYTAE